MAMRLKQPGIAHYLLTRFNVRLDFDLPAKDVPNALGLDAGWLERRFGLFERYCLPSVAEQTNRSFRWLVFMDEDTPEAYKGRIRALAEKHDFLLPQFCRGFSGSEVLQRIDAIQASGADLRITSRLDNDDMLHPRYIERMQSRARAEASGRNLEKGFFLAFPLGCCLQGRDAYIQRYRNNPFSSYVSAPSVGKTVLDTDHRYIADMAPVVYEWHCPMWCQVIHGENVANELRGMYWPFERRFSQKAAPGPRHGPAWKIREFFTTAVRYATRRQGR